MEPQDFPWLSTHDPDSVDSGEFKWTVQLESSSPTNSLSSELSERIDLEQLSDEEWSSSDAADGASWSELEPVGRAMQNSHQMSLPPMVAAAPDPPGAGAQLAQLAAPSIPSEATWSQVGPPGLPPAGPHIKGQWSNTSAVSNPLRHDPGLAKPGPGAQLALPAARAVPLQGSSSSLVGPPGLPPAGPHIKRQRSDASAVSHPLKYDAGEIPGDEVIKYLLAEQECCRPPWMLSDGSTYEDMYGRVYIEHSFNNRNAGPHGKTRTDLWKTTGGYEPKHQDTGKHFKEDGAGRRVLCGPTDAGVRGTIKAKKIIIMIRLRSHEEPHATVGIKMKADLWKVCFCDHAAVEGATAQPSPDNEVYLYHILPSHITRRGQDKKTKTPPRRSTRAAAAGDVDERKAVTRADGDERETHHGPMVIKADRHDRRLVTFCDPEGEEKGKIVYHDHGVALVSTSADLAEYYPRAPGEAEFEEGDVVGLHDKGEGRFSISRVTEGADMVGVITRRPLHIGNSPPRDAHLWDTVAHDGQVPVKLRGPAAPGNMVVPSGRNDGTAVVARHEGRVLSQPLGTVLSEQVSMSEDTNKPQLVQVKVQKPSANNVRVAAHFNSIERDLDQMSLQIANKGREPTPNRRLCVGVVAALLAVLAWRLHTTLDNHERVPRVVVPTAGCYPENVNAIELTRCDACNGDTVRFDHQQAGEGMEVACPVGFAGTLRRMCSDQNKSHISGRCVRTACPEQRVKLPGGTSVTVAPVDNGLTQMTTCPEPGFTGQLLQQCLENSTWAERVGECTRHMCSSGVEYFAQHIRYFNSSEYNAFQTVPVVVPSIEYGRDVQVAVCTQFSRTGSCTHNVGDAGYARAICDEGGKRSVDRESSVLASARSYDVLRMSKSLPQAQSMYHTFVSSITSAVHPPTGSSWSLPAKGILTPVMIGLEGERREVFAAADSPLERSDRPGSIDTNPGYNSQSMSERNHALAGGRAAAAFARAACTELGFNDAPFVTSCRGLASLLDDLPYRPPNAIKLLGELCPEVQRGYGDKCPNWLEVRDPPLNDTQLEWLRASMLTPIDHDGLHAAPVFEDVDTKGLPDWRDLQSFADVGPVPESPSCDGSEDHVLRCFQRQMVIPIALRKMWKRDCSRRLIVGCSKPVDPAPDDLIHPDLGAAILLADVKPLPDYGGFAISVAVRPADFHVDDENITVEATVSGPVTPDDGQNTTGRTDVTAVGCPHITRQVPANLGVFPLSNPTSFEMRLPPQCQHRWSPFRRHQYKVVLRLNSFPKYGKQPALLDPRGSTVQKFAKLRSVTEHDGTWVVGDSVRPYPDKSTPLTRPKIFVDTGGPFNCTTGDLATRMEIITSVRQLCWGKTIREPDQVAS